MKFRTLVAILLTLVFSTLEVSFAEAHSTEPRVEISIERLHPGEVVNVRGVSFGMDDSVTLALIGSGVDISLGEILANAEGDFTHITLLPADLVEGTYYFRATTSHHFVLSPPITVWGTAIMEGGGQGERDEDDGLLAPMPTFPPAVVTSPVPQVTEATPTPSWNPTLFALVALTVMAIAIGLVIKKKT